MASRLTGILLAVTTVLSTACGSSPSPTEPASAPAGSLVIAVTQPCPLSGTVSVLLDGKELGVIQVPGETRFSVSPGIYSVSFRRGAEVFAAAGSAGQVQVISGGVATLTDPPGICLASPH